MLKVLLLDNSEEKVKAVIQALTDNCNIPENCIKVVKSVSSCRNSLREESYDLLILDLLVPQFDDDEEEDVDEGPKYVEELYKDPDINIPDQIMGLTEHDEWADKVKSTYEDAGWLLVKYSQSDNSWVKVMQSKVFHIKKFQEGFKKMKENSYQIGILCALNDEFVELQAAFGNDSWKKEVVSGYPYVCYSTSVSTGQGSTFKIIASCVNKPGSIATSIFSTMMYQVFGIEYLFMVGFAAGFKSKSLRLGDVVVAESIQDYGTGKIIDEVGELKILKEIHQLPGNPSLISIANRTAVDASIRANLNKDIEVANLKKNKRDQVEVYVSPTVCGPYVVANKEVMKELKGDSRKLQALDMEGFGLYLSSYFLDKKCLWIKGVSDFADQKKKDDYHKAAAFASARFLYYLIKENL